MSEIIFNKNVDKEKYVIATYFLESKNIYYTSYFLENVISSSDLDEFTKLVRKSAIKYLESLKSETV